MGQARVLGRVKGLVQGGRPTCIRMPLAVPSRLNEVRSRTAHAAGPSNSPPAAAEFDDLLIPFQRASSWSSTSSNKAYSATGRTFVRTADSRERPHFPSSLPSQDRG